MAIDGEPELSITDHLVFDEGRLDSALAIVATGNSYNMPHSSLFDGIEARARNFVSSERHDLSSEYRHVALRSLGRINVLRNRLLTESQPDEL